MSSPTMNFSMVKLHHDLLALGIRDNQEIAVLLYLVFSSRKMRDTLSTTLVGPSASGKSTLAQAVVSLIPKHDRFELSFITKAALLHASDLRGKTILLHEQLEDPALAAPFRQLA